MQKSIVQFGKCGRVIRKQHNKNRNKAIEIYFCSDGGIWGTIIFYNPPGILNQCFRFPSAILSLEVF